MKIPPPLPVSAHPPRLVRFQFRILYADPPWRYQSGHPLPYPTLATAHLCALPIQGLCAGDCALFLWATYPLLPVALDVMSAWGSSYKTVTFTWVKQNPSGDGFHFGMGNWTRANPELYLLGTRGLPRRVSASVPNLLVSPRREHSRKPDEVRDRIVALCGDLPRAELFAGRGRKAGAPGVTRSPTTSRCRLRRSSETAARASHRVAAAFRSGCGFAAAPPLPARNAGCRSSGHGLRW